MVGTTAGYAIIIQGKIGNEEGLESHNKTANRVYRTLLTRGFADQNIFYFNHNPPQDANLDGVPDDAITQAGVGVDFVPIKSDVRELIQSLAPTVNNNPAPVYLILVDHGAPSPVFFLNENETISPEELSVWIESLEDSLTVEAKKDPRVVIIGTCYSGGFIPQLSGQNRVIVVSSAADEESYKGPQEADGIRVGEYFPEEFFQQLGRGKDFRTAFLIGTSKTERYTRTGGGLVVRNGFLDAASQHPLLDDDGHRVGSKLIDEKSGDGRLASELILGMGPNYDVNSTANSANIVSVTDTLFLANNQSAAALHLVANEFSQVGQAYVEIRSPAKAPTPQGGTEQLSTDYVRRQMLPPGGQGNPFIDRFYLKHSAL